MSFFERLSQFFSNSFLFKFILFFGIVMAIILKLAGESLFLAFVLVIALCIPVIIGILAVHLYSKNYYRRGVKVVGEIVNHEFIRGIRGTAPVERATVKYIYNGEKYITFVDFDIATWANKVGNYNNDNKEVRFVDVYVLPNKPSKPYVDTSFVKDGLY